MASNQSVLEQMLQAALQGGGLRAGQGATTPSQAAPGGPGNLGDILGTLLGGSPTAGGGATAGRSVPAGSGGLGDILGSILGGAVAGNNASNDTSWIAGAVALQRGRPPGRSSSRPKCHKRQERTISSGMAAWQ